MLDVNAGLAVASWCSPFLPATDVRFRITDPCISADILPKDSKSQSVVNIFYTPARKKFDGEVSAAITVLFLEYLVL